MSLAFTCPACQAQLRLADTLAGKKIRCPKCKEVIAVPAAEPADAQPEPELLEAEPEHPPTQPERSARVSAGKPQPRPAGDKDRPARARRDEDDDEGMVPRRGGKPAHAKGGNSALMWLLIILGSVVLVCGGAIAVVVIMVNQAVTTAKQELDKLDKAMTDKLQDKEKDPGPQDPWPDQWERHKVYQVPAGPGLTLTSRLAKTDEENKATKGQFQKVFLVQMQADTVYNIGLKANPKKGFDTILRVEDAAGKMLAFNDDAPGEGVNSRILFTCHQAGNYRIVASHLWGTFGEFTLTITKSAKVGKLPVVDTAVAVTTPRLTITRKSVGVADAALSPSGDLLAFSDMLAGKPDDRYHLWDVQANKPKIDVAVGTALRNPVAFSADGKTVARGGYNSLHLWDVNVEQPRKLTGLKGTINALVFLADNRLVIGSTNANLKIWNPATGVELKSVNLPKAVRHLACSADGRLAATLFQGSSVPQLWNLETGQEVVVKLPVPTTAQLALSPDGKTLALNRFTGEILLVDTQTGVLLQTLVGHKNQITGLCFSADGKVLASSSEDKTARVWDAATGQGRAVFRAHSSDVLCVSLSADGRVLATGGREGFLMIWDVPAAK